MFSTRSYAKLKYYFLFRRYMQYACVFGLVAAALSSVIFDVVLPSATPTKHLKQERKDQLPKAFPAYLKKYLNSSIVTKFDSSVPLLKEEAVKGGLIENVASFWRLPDKPPKAVYLLFHGCHHDPEHFFFLPEERQIVAYLLKHNYVALALGSQERDPQDGSRCWDNAWPPQENRDLVAVPRAVRVFLEALQRAASDFDAANKARAGGLQGDSSGSGAATGNVLPVFAFGASSGGTFSSMIPAVLPDIIKGTVVQISPGHPAAFSADYPPVAFVYMARDRRTAQMVKQNVAVLKMRAGVSEQNGLQSGSHGDQVKAQVALGLECGPHPLSPALLGAKIPALGMKASSEIFEAMVRGHYLDCRGPDQSFCLLAQNSRPVVQYFEAMDEYLSDESRNLFDKHIMEIEEVLNVLWAAHEMTSEHVEVWESWLYSKFLGT